MSEQHQLKEMSVPEKEMLCNIVPESAPLPYPTCEMKMPDGYQPETEYIIPAGEKERLLEELWPFRPVPKMGSRRFDIHQMKTFAVRRFRVIRSRNRNFVVSPYYSETGGMAVDWMPGVKSRRQVQFGSADAGGSQVFFGVQTVKTTND